jgi:hypothetical protein
VQHGNVELKDSLPESGIAWSSAASLVAVIAIAALLGIVIYLFTRWRDTGQRTVAVSAATDHVPEKNSEGGAGKAPSETTIGKASEVVMPISFALADKMIQLPDENGQSATISMSQNSGCSSETESTNEEILPDTVLSESSRTAALSRTSPSLQSCALWAHHPKKSFSGSRG